MLSRIIAFAFAAAATVAFGLPATASAAPLSPQYSQADAARIILVADDEEMMMEGDDGTVGNDEAMEDDMMDDEPGDDMMGDEEMESEDEAM
ncbi:hypothetical protein A7A08_03118 [Methyloligella halotolerans]|uniref:Uncharacterized protein n=1 Tax=Methyloligella halotolerans TaxID=1177755 RepID=A0A1E2RV13_9HYPH|nr:hypothetical protein [Methyloligella halotolerans]ODA65975.1 hypothetical protein A7A08_03118 [Methyloligella halotolerans]